MQPHVTIYNHMPYETVYNKKYANKYNKQYLNKYNKLWLDARNVSIVLMKLFIATGNYRVSDKKQGYISYEPINSQKS